MKNTLVALTSFALLSTAQELTVEDLRRDSVKYGPELELVHLYYDEFPTGIAVSREGRMFSNYPPGLDANNTNNGQNNKYTIAELLANNTEQAYPSAEINNPPGGAINYTTSPPSGANYQDYLIGSQSCVIDSASRLWILDTGRALTPDGTLVPASYGGPKLIGVDLSTNEVIQTIVFPITVAFADSYLNDVRFDLSTNTAYITDSSVEGRNGIVVVNIETGESWRHLDGHPSTRPEQQWVSYLWGIPLYGWRPNQPFNYGAFGTDGIALSADGKTLYWKVVAGRYLFSIPTERLRDNSLNSEVLAQGAIQNHGQTGVTDGMETDSNGLIYHGNMEQNAISVFNPQNGSDALFVRDARLDWIDTFATGFDGYLYFTNNQLVSPTIPIE